MKTSVRFALLVTCSVILACSTDGPGVRTVAPSPRTTVPALTPLSIDATTAADYPGLENLVGYAPRLISGGAPDGEAGFDALQAMGVKTIISVDGARPEVDKARARGMRYIHLPIGYNGMDQERTLEIARAVELAREDGPVYIHCHHGKHRSAGAAGAAAVTLGLLTTTEATARMKVSGTSPNYSGLYQCVAVAEPAGPETLEAVKTDFPEVWKTSGLVRSMVEIDQTLDQLKAIEAAGWRTPKDCPDLVPVAEAGRLADLFRTLRNDPQARAKPTEFSDWLLAASNAASSVEVGVAGDNPSPQQLNARLKTVAASCKQCHVKYRD